MDIVVKESKMLDEGLHKGAIVGIEYRTEPFAYTDVLIESEGVNLKASYPTEVSEKSALGKLMARFGALLVVGQSLSPESVLIGQPCQFLVSVAPGKDGKEYANILRDSVKPIPLVETCS